MKIRSDILRVYQTLHTWTGICAGMLLFIGFLGGALTMFKEPLDRWVSAPRPGASYLAPAQLDVVVREVLARHPAARESLRLDLLQRENAQAPVTWSTSADGPEIDLDARRWSATLDADGRLAAVEERPSLLAELIDMLHRTGGIPGMLGDEYLGVYLMGIAGVLYFLALVSGVVLLLPTLVKDLFALRPGKNRKRFWLDAHNVIGIASLPFHIVISLTVIVFAFHDQFYDSLKAVVYQERPLFQSGPADPAKTHAVADLLPASALAARVRAEAPGFELIEMMYWGLEGPRPLVRAAVAHPGHVVQGPLAGYVMIDPYSGEITDTSMLPTRSDTWSALVAPFFALHFGSYGGDLTRWLYFAFGLSGAFIFYSGNLLWIEKRRKQQPPALQPRRTVLIASATVGVCLGCVAAICSTMVAAKWLHATVENINVAYLAVYYSVFLLCVLWAFLRGAARAAVELLRVCAASALALPATSLAALLFPRLGMWAHGSMGAVAVDLVALAAGLLLLYAARSTRARVERGTADSVWAAA